VIDLSGFSFAADVDSKSRQSAFKKAMVVVEFAFLWANRKKSLKNAS